MFGDLYHNRVLELAADIPPVGHLADARGSSLKVWRVCGSTVEVDVKLDEGRGARRGDRGGAQGARAGAGGVSDACVVRMRVMCIWRWSVAHGGPGLWS